MVISSAVSSDQGNEGRNRQILRIEKTRFCKDSVPNGVVRSRVDTISHLPNNARFYTDCQWHAAI